MDLKSVVELDHVQRRCIDQSTMKVKYQADSISPASALNSHISWSLIVFIRVLVRMVPSDALDPAENYDLRLA